jgi:hypothetical protein
VAERITDVATALEIAFASTYGNFDDHAGRIQHNVARTKTHNGRIRCDRGKNREEGVLNSCFRLRGSE